MTISASGASITRNITALDNGQGFTIRVNGAVNFKDRTATREAQARNLAGEKIRGHETALADAQTEAKTAEDGFISQLTAFINDWNADPVGPEGLADSYA